MEYNIKNIKEILKEVFSNSDLLSFIQDYFPEYYITKNYEGNSRDIDKIEVIRHLVDFSQRSSKLEVLAKILKAEHPKKVDNYPIIENNSNFNNFTNITYKHLFDFDFEHQTKYFESFIISEKPLLMFIIRANPDFGQKWLYNKLIYLFEKEQPINPTISIDLSKNILDFNGFLDFLSEKLQPENYDKNDDEETKKIVIRNAIINKIKLSNQFIIFQNAYSFIKSEHYFQFKEMLNGFKKEIKANKKHRCIFFFVENSDSIYPETDCIFSNCTQDYIAKIENELKFIDLDTIKPINIDVFKSWFSKVPEKIIKAFKDDIIENLIIESKGNPENLIQPICKIMNINFKEIQEQCLKH